MADYKELLRRAISALPENNGAARRAVYEKARSALVGQLRAITPPLPARDITQHRLQLEDCIRQVEQEASEAVISLGREPVSRPVAETAPRPAPVPPPQPRPTAPAKAADPAPVPVAEAPKPAEPVQVAATPAEPAREPDKLAEPPKAAGNGRTSIEDIIAEAAATSGAEVSAIPDKPASRPTPPPPRPAAPVTNIRSIDAPLKSPSIEPRREPVPLAANSAVEPIRAPMRVEPTLGNQALARQSVTVPVEAALSSVREVELEAVQPDMNEAQGAIERAIETLDREARGEPTAPLPDPNPAAKAGAFGIAGAEDETASGFVEEPTAAARSGAGLTIFLVVFAILLAGVGGAGFWAWREGYVDLDQMFGQSQPAVAEVTTPATPTTPTMDPVPAEAPATTDVSVGPGNTATTATDEATVSLEGVEIDDRLEPTPEPVVPTGTESVLPSLGGEEAKSEERLTDESAVAAVDTTDPAASVDPAVLAGSQSLLLEASQDGRTGAVPFSGTVEWSEGTDELGLPTLIGHASIPARSLGVNLTIRKNSDPSLPASHLMEVDFDVSDTFIGGAISNLPGVLLKDEELVPGTPLVGASARVVGNSFLFALSASETDAAVNADLLENRRWMDLAVVYGTGRNAILTLEKDDTAQALFEKVFDAWSQ